MVLESVLSAIDSKVNLSWRVLSAIQHKSDAGAFQLDENTILLQNVDYITPLVNDPELFGAIAVANAFSDIYAMGGIPITALNILAFPSDRMSPDTVGRILKGGMSKIREAGADLIGGHSINNEELIYGITVTGLARRDELVLNSTAEVGDLLLLTKPLGSALVAAAVARNSVQAGSTEYEDAVESMLALNKFGAQAMKTIPVNACIDVSGFGFLGHLWEMCVASGVGAVIETGKVPYFLEAQELLKQGVKSSAKERNLQYLLSNQAIEHTKPIDDSLFDLLLESETSGGLLMSVPKADSKALITKIKELSGQTSYVSIVGEIAALPPRIVLI